MPRKKVHIKPSSLYIQSIENKKFQTSQIQKIYKDIYMKLHQFIHRQNQRHRYLVMAIMTIRPDKSWRVY